MWDSALPQYTESPWPTGRLRYEIRVVTSQGPLPEPPIQEALDPKLLMDVRLQLSRLSIGPSQVDLQKDPISLPESPLGPTPLMSVHEDSDQDQPSSDTLYDTLYSLFHNNLNKLSETSIIDRNPVKLPNSKFPTELNEIISSFLNSDSSLFTINTLVYTAARTLQELHAKPTTRDDKCYFNAA